MCVCVRAYYVCVSGKLWKLDAVQVVQWCRLNTVMIVVLCEIILLLAKMGRGYTVA